MRYKDCTLNYWQKAEDFAAYSRYWRAVVYSDFPLRY